MVVIKEYGLTRNSKEWKDYVKNRQKVNSSSYRVRLRNEAIDILGGRCANPNCRWVNEDGSVGCTDRRCLQIDHKKGGGSIHSKLVSPMDRHREIIRNLDRGEWFQLLCSNCNWIKRVENKECDGNKPIPEIPYVKAKDVIAAITKAQPLQGI